MCPLALKEETKIGEEHDPLVILTKRGIAYLDKQWSKQVNKNGKKVHGKSSRVLEIPERQANVQRLDNRIINLVLPFYKAPDR